MTIIELIQATLYTTDENFVGQLHFEHCLVHVTVEKL